ncbi:hypothetical protein QQ045_008112 [Rhodiola kirilowii]
MTRWHRAATDLSHALTRRSLLLLHPLPLSTQPRSHQSSIRRIRSSIDSLLHQKILDRRTAEKLDEDLHRANCILSDGDAATYLHGKTQGMFLKMFLGPIDVRATRKEIQFKVKEDYITTATSNIASFKVLALEWMHASFSSSTVSGSVHETWSKKGSISSGLSSPQLWILLEVVEVAQRGREGTVGRKGANYRRLYRGTNYQ